MQEKHAILPGQSTDLLKELHILTRDGQLNQDSRRKLKQVYHLIGFIEPLIQETAARQPEVNLVDFGAGKSYLGFLLYDLFFKDGRITASVHGIEARNELVEKACALAARLGFAGMRFHALDAANAASCPDLPQRIDIVTALHACDTATDDAIRFALKRQARFVVLVPCCQAEIAALLRKHKSRALANPLTELWRHPLHTREFGSLVTNVLRCLQLEAHGYQVSVTELVGWEHSLKNELIVARRTGQPARHRGARLREILAFLGLEAELSERFFLP
ncbi:class I SAM-dependent methyltransferase [Sulfuricystis thermophila]|uniref:class I SAM-dependent methyltransferase n=1 Tax=Sulfuricystis thermophila TaxID=2496847 RepID=UPI0010357C7F|nr:SAM-dependent methyltransferase [Sulfuricystis thermophila]